MINWLRRQFCKHEFEFKGTVNVYFSDKDIMPWYYQDTYLCKKCLYKRKVKR